jgi:hypothetical protein
VHAFAHSLPLSDLKKQLDIPATIKEIVGADKEAAYMAKLDELAENACVPAQRISRLACAC